MSILTFQWILLSNALISAPSRLVGQPVYRQVRGFVDISQITFNRFMLLGNAVSTPAGPAVLLPKARVEATECRNVGVDVHHKLWMLVI